MINGKDYMIIIQKFQSTLHVEAQLESDKLAKPITAIYDYGDMCERFGSKNLIQTLYDHLNLLDDLLVLDMDVNHPDVKSSYYAWIEDLTK